MGDVRRRGVTPVVALTLAARPLPEGLTSATEDENVTVTPDIGRPKAKGTSASRGC